MDLKNLFSIFLALVLVSTGVYFVIGGSYFSTPANNVTFLYGNYSMVITINTTGVTNAHNVTLYNVTDNTMIAGASSALDGNNTIVNASNSSASTSTLTVVLNTGNFTSGYIAGRGDGNYTFTALIANGSNTIAYVNVTAMIDNKPPYLLTLIYPYMNQTFTNNGTIYFGFNVSDAMSGNYTRGNTINCSLFVDGTAINNSIVAWNTTDFTLVNMTQQQNVINASYVLGVTTTGIDSGDHTWNMTCYDFNNNFNSTASFIDHNVTSGVRQKSGGNFTIVDTQGPTTATSTFSASSVTEGGSVTITCVGTDIITLNPVEYVSVKGPLGGDWQGDIGTSPYIYTGTGDVGTYTVRCRSKDTTGNFGGYSSEATFSVTRTATSTTTSGSGVGGGSGTVSVTALTGQTRDLGSLDTANGIINAYQSSIVTFTISSSAQVTASAHSVKFDNVDYIKGEVTITISSDPVTLTMKTGETKNVDIDDDEVEDLEVKLNSIDENGQVNMNIRNIAITEAIPAEGTPTETAPTEPEGAKGGTWIWWVLIVVVIVVIIALLVPKKKRK